MDGKQGIEAKLHYSQARGGGCVISFETGNTFYGIHCWEFSRSCQGMLRYPKPLSSMLVAEVDYLSRRSALDQSHHW